MRFLRNLSAEIKLTFHNLRDLLFPANIEKHFSEDAQKANAIAGWLQIQAGG
jgi:hypothetical protein